MSRNLWPVLLISICFLFCPVRIHGFSWNIFSSSSAPKDGDGALVMELEGAVADFALDGTNDPRGLKLLENARNKLAGPRNCWQEAYRNSGSCSPAAARSWPTRRGSRAWRGTSAAASKRTQGGRHSRPAQRDPRWCTAASGSANPKARSSSSSFWRPTPCATNCSKFGFLTWHSIADMFSVLNFV